MLFVSITTTTISVTGNGTFNWFATSSSTIVLATGSSATLYTTGTTTYWVEASIGTCFSAGGRSPVTVTVNPKPTPLTLESRCLYSKTKG